MSSTAQPEGSSRNRRLIIIAVVGIVVIAILGLVAAWLFFFGSEAPQAPTLDNAIKVLLPSASPQ